MRIARATIERRSFYRNRVSNFLVWSITAFAALYFLTELVRAIEQPDESPVLIGLFAVMLVAFLVPAIRFPRNGVLTTSAVVIIRNICRTHVLQWDDLERFEVASDFVPRGGVAVLKDGRRIAMTGITQGVVGHFVANTVAALNAELAEATARHDEHPRAPV